MLNSYSSQTNLLNRFSHDEGLMDYATAKSKLTEIFFQHHGTPTPRKYHCEPVLQVRLVY